MENQKIWDRSSPTKMTDLRREQLHEKEWQRIDLENSIEELDQVKKFDKWIRLLRLKVGSNRTDQNILNPNPIYL